MPGHSRVPEEVLRQPDNHREHLQHDSVPSPQAPGVVRAKTPRAPLTAKTTGPEDGVGFEGISNFQEEALRLKAVLDAQAVEQHITGMTGDLRSLEVRFEQPSFAYENELEAILPAAFLGLLDAQYKKQLTELLAKRDRVAQQWYVRHEALKKIASDLALRVGHAEEALKELARYIEWDPEQGAYIGRETPTKVLADVLALGEPLLVAQATKELDTRTSTMEVIEAGAQPMFDKLSGEMVPAVSIYELQAKLGLAASAEATRQGFKYVRSNCRPDEVTGELHVSVDVEGRPKALLDRAAFKRALMHHTPSTYKMAFTINVSVPL